MTSAPGVVRELNVVIRLSVREEDVAPIGHVLRRGVDAAEPGPTMDRSDILGEAVNALTCYLKHRDLIVRPPLPVRDRCATQLAADRTPRLAPLRSDLLVWPYR